MENISSRIEQAVGILAHIINQQQNLISNNIGHLLAQPTLITCQSS